ncbi:acyltransferase [Atopobium sp. oral taxon 199]|uniref:acyltransferase family protein n=1 Tax=Atopobium sp. oral taxon 199 TaxID=712156 RepID=UPI00034E4692|nr:acyltransferase [Atopobium sp. oral taxon 199]EPD78806.1 hypothetical protein HMPREF1527_01143 [Atopobium sp. oral taxon 199 str. F0494]
MTSLKLSDVAESRVNNLNLMRFVAAIFVIISHCYSVVLGSDAGDFVYRHTKQLTFGGMSVGLFFVFGGFLIARSCEHHSDAKTFFKQRVSRLFPELIFVVSASALVLGPLVSTLAPGEYFTNPQTYRYFLNSFLIMVHELPGVFTNNPLGNTVNASLWTLPVEFCCYILCFIGFKLTRFNQKRFILASVPVVALIVLYVWKFSPQQLSVVRAVVLFYIGVAFWVFRDKIRIHTAAGIVATAAFCVLLYAKLDVLATMLLFPYVCFWLGYGTGGRFSNFGKKFELSYGIYLWAFPIQQTLVQLFPTWPIYGNAVCAALLAICGAFLNYAVIVRPLKKNIRQKQTLR